MSPDFFCGITIIQIVSDYPGYLRFQCIQEHRPLLHSYSVLSVNKQTIATFRRHMSAKAPGSGRKTVSSLIKFEFLRVYFIWDGINLRKPSSSSDFILYIRRNMNVFQKCSSVISCTNFEISSRFSKGEKPSPPFLGESFKQVGKDTHCDKPKTRKRLWNQVLKIWNSSCRFYPKFVACPYLK